MELMLVLMDEAKGLPAALDEVFPEWRRFWCCKHRAANVPGKQGNRKQYWRWVKETDA